MQEILTSVNNNYEDNYDHLRYGPLNRSRKPTSLKQKVKDKLNEKGYFHRSNINYAVTAIADGTWIKDFEYLYELLEDDESRALLVKLVAYRLLGHEKVRLPLSTPEYWKSIEEIESHQSETDLIEIDFMDFKLKLTDLSFLNIPLKLYYTAFGTNIDFIVRQYEFHRNGVHIQADPGDVVIDGGGCFGDTALYFSDKIKGEGTTYVFEFIPDNIAILRKNIGLNPRHASSIRLVENPLWSHSEEEVFYLSNGPGSRVSFQPFEGYSGKTTTLSIDDFVDRQRLEKVDFIKMDIEGAEIKALYGAEETLRKYKPKLSIALYHSTADFEVIPRYLKNLDLGYRFYLSHSTIFSEETMLFAKAD